MNDKEAKFLKRRKLKIWHILIIFFIILAGAFVFFRLNTKKKIQSRVEAIRTAGYPVTLEELNQWYWIPNDTENLAYIIMDACGYYYEPNDSETLPFFGRQVELPARTEKFSDDTIKYIVEFLSQNQKCLEFLHKTPELEYGRFPIDLTFGHASLLPNLSEIRRCVFLLQLEAIYSVECNNPELVVDSIKSMFGTARSLSKEPITVSQLVRIACQQRPVQTLEYAMNRLFFSDAQLKEVQKEFANAQNSSDISRAFVGERCMTMSVLEDPTMIEPQMLGDEMLPMPVLQAYKALGLADNEIVVYLDLNNEIMKVFDLPLHKRIEALNTIETKSSSISKMYILINQFMPAYSRIIKIDLRIIAELRAAQIAIAIERYRLANESLPDSLGDLVPEYIENIPLDPFDGKEMRYKKLDTGFVIYSVGEDLADDNGKKQPESSRERNETTWDIPFTIER